jgi:uncharacterized protein (TIGR02266 family)
MDEEKRRAWRSTIILEVKYEGAGVRAETRISDLSATGVFVDTMSPPPVGSHLRLSFRLPDGHLIEAEGVVAQAQPGIGMGIDYTKINPEDVRRIRQIIHP